MPSVSALYIYPIKGCRGLELQGFRLDELGPQLDHRFMLVDATGNVVTQREEPRLLDVVPALSPTAFNVRASGMRALKLALSLPDHARVREVQIGEHRGPALIADEEHSDWFSEYLNRACSLVWMPRRPLRLVDPKLSPEPAYTAFSDGFPVRIVSTATLAKHPGLTVESVRPNIVITGLEPSAEDAWARVRIGEVPFDLVASEAPCRHGIHRELGMLRVKDAIEPV
jgi:uncharacterized protein YcbX